MPRLFRYSALSLILAGSLLTAMAQRQRVILDTDLGDDIDDAYAISAALHSPELDVLGITTAWGDTALRARLAERLAQDCGAKSLPVLPGQPTQTAALFTQRPYAEAGPPAEHGSAVDFLLAEARRHPHQVTLLALGPLSNIAAAIERDPQGFRLLRRVVLMGGSIHRGYDPAASDRPGNRPAAHRRPSPPVPEYNIASDPAAAQKLLAAGVPVFLMPLDATQWRLDDRRLAQVAARSTPTTDALLVLTTEWQLANHIHTPTLYDAMTVAYAVHPELCPTTPLRLSVDAKGATLVVAGAPNAQVCLKADGEAFFNFLLPRLTTPQ